jgi:hypothetical protein
MAQKTNCKCKEDVTPRKEDFEQNVLLMIKEEKEVQERFNQLCYWGFNQLCYWGFNQLCYWGFNQLCYWGFSYLWTEVFNSK